MGIGVGLRRLPRDGWRVIRAKPRSSEAYLRISSWRDINSSGVKFDLFVLKKKIEEIIEKMSTSCKGSSHLVKRENVEILSKHGEGGRWVNPISSFIF